MSAATIGELSVKLADAAIVARGRGDQVNALFFAIKAAETLALAKALGWKPEEHRDGLNGQARNPAGLPDSSGDLASAGGIAGVDITDHRRQVGTPHDGPTIIPQQGEKP